MKPLNIILFKRFMRVNGINQLFAGMYRQLRFPGSPEDIEEYLKKVDANDVVINAFKFPAEMGDFKYGNSYWFDVALKWQKSMENARVSGFYKKKANMEWVEMELTRPLAAPNRHAIREFISEEPKTESKTPAPCVREKEDREESGNAILPNNEAAKENLSVHKFDFIDFGKKSMRAGLNENTISFHNHKSNYSLVFNSIITKEVEKSGLLYSHFSFIEDKKIFAIVFSNDPAKGLPVRNVISKNLTISNKALLGYVTSFFGIQSNLNGYLYISKNKANSKDYLTYHITNKKQ